MQLALYKGPPTNLKHKAGHAVTCWWTDSIYSHCELVIDGTCYSSSSRDGGIRAKEIDIASGRWDVIDLHGYSKEQEINALDWFAFHRGVKYDWLGLLSFVLPFRVENRNKYFCSEAVAAALGLPDPWQHTPQTLFETLTAVNKTNEATP